MKITPSLRSHLICIGIIAVAVGGLSVGAAPLPLNPGKTVEVAGAHGGFDFLEVDATSSPVRLLAPHTRNGTFDVFALPEGKPVQLVEAGATQDAAVDSRQGLYYVSGSDKPRVLTLDQKTLKAVGETPLPGPADILVFDPDNGLAYVGHDDASEVWAVDVAAHKIVATIPIPEGPEGFAYDAKTQRIFVNERKTSAIEVIDTKKNQVIASWPTAPAQSPHGLAMTPDGKTLFVAGGNGMLAEVSTATGKVTASTAIASRVDEIAYDVELQRVYCASGTGVLSVVQVTDRGLQSLGEVPTHKGTHSVAIDPGSHVVWTAYGDAQKSYLYSLVVPK
ncbi:MAG: YncE family protein [Chthoniobacteraceae bacterium]